MSAAIFLTPCGNGGYTVEVGEDHTSRADRGANLVIVDKWGDMRIVSLGLDDWEQLRDRIDQILHNRQETR